ncbi:MAG: hypothetical protein NZM12_13805, partial [Steroidobacteraceae bacterium]|nr:hypothetical protein [Steroidobacteraceae bacterium]MDW8258140.1 hypothetical protein [Gammaproteobacteria bacterium]
MIRRREIIGFAAGSALLARYAQAQTAADPVAALDAARIAASPAHDAYLPRGADGRLARLATLDLESLQDFTLGFRLVQAKTIRSASMRALERLLAREGIDPQQPMTVQQIRALVADDPAVNLAAKAWIANQQVTWHTLHDHFHRYAEHYLGELARADRSGPGTLELSPRI